MAAIPFFSPEFFDVARRILSAYATQRDSIALYIGLADTNN